MTGERRVPVSIVCVYNNPAVLGSCLARSIDLARADAPRVELIAIDNRDGRFPSAGAALNHGACKARHEVVVFVHQDVYLHSLPALEAAAGSLLDDPGVGLLGAVGTTSSGRVLGIVRDRVVMIGSSSDMTTPVDSIDEVLFMLRRADVLASPLTEDPELAWHAYAVEYAARERSRGRRVVTADVAITHNSMTVNLDRLAEAHARVAALYPGVVPLQTTCGVVRSADDRGGLRTLARRRRGLATWLGESRTARRLSRETSTAIEDIVLGDVRWGIDDALDLLGATGLDVVNVEPDPKRAWEVTELERRDLDVTARHLDRRDLPDVLGAREPGRALLFTGREDSWIPAVTARLRPEDRLVGLARDTGAWLLVADGAHRARTLWPSWRNRAVGTRRASSGSGRPRQRGRTPLRGRAAVRFWGAAVALSDLAPPGIRYGHLHPAARRFLQRPLPVLVALPGIAFEPDLPPAVDAPSDVTCVLVADHLDVGGVGRVVEMLALGLGAHGVRPVVLCPAEGERSGRLRARGIEVAVASDARTARDHLDRIQPDVIQTHSAPTFLVEASLETPGAAVVPVLHNTEIHYNREMWERAGALCARSAYVIAGSEVVRRFHLEHLPATPGESIVVVPNGAMPVGPLSPDLRAGARRALEKVVGVSLAETTVVVCLARYDSQKNITGLVASFLRAGDAGATLVVAGDPSDWLELHRAASVKAAHPAGDRVHLLGSSDAATLLAAADAFVLDSFFEGWPLATTEAVACGLPIIVSDTGGARELVARARPGSKRVANPTGPAEAVTDAAARRARRNALAQPNSEELAEALRRMAGWAREEGGGATGQDTSYLRMVAEHARIIRSVPAAVRERTGTDA